MRFKIGDHVRFVFANKPCRVGATAVVTGIRSESNVHLKILECPLESSEVGKELGADIDRLVLVHLSNKSASLHLKR